MNTSALIKRVNQTLKGDIKYLSSQMEFLTGFTLADV